MPHEIFPDLIYWEPGDRIEKDEFVRYTYEGILNGQFVLCPISDRQPIAYIPPTAISSYRNYNAATRKRRIEQEALSHQLASDEYNRFLREFA